MSPATRDILTAPEVIAVDQDPRGVQGTQVGDYQGTDQPEIWSKPLTGRNTFAVVLFNRSDAAVEMTVTWTDLGLPAGAATPLAQGGSPASRPDASASTHAT